MEIIQQKIIENPVYFLDNVLGSEHWKGQRLVISEVFKNQRVTVKSCHGIGKTYLASRLALAFLFAYTDSIVVTTAPTFRQVEQVMWREIRGAHSRSRVPLGGKLLKTQFEISENWYALGLSAEKPDALAGIHAKSSNILIIVDEASGVKEEIMQVIEALLTSDNVHLLYIGNPTKTLGSFYNSFTSQLFRKISIPCFLTPNFTKNGIKTVEQLKAMTRDEVKALPLVYPELVTPLWAWERMDDWGEDSPIFQSRVLAKFPEESDATLIPLYMVEEALSTILTEKENPLFWEKRQIGIDCARFGNDLSVFTAVKGNTANEIEHIDTRWVGKRDTMEVVGNAINFFNDLGFNKKYDRFIVDDTGLGGGITDRLVELGYIVLPINFACGSDDSRFNSIKAEMFWNLRELFKNKKIKIKDIGKIIAEVPTIQYDYDSGGKIKIVSKKARKSVTEAINATNKSPDFADSLALACFNFTNSNASVYTQSEIKVSSVSPTIVGNLLEQTF